MCGGQPIDDRLSADRRIVALGESCVMAISGGVLGLAVAWAAITLIGDPTHGMLPLIYLPTRDALAGFALVLVLGFATGILPAYQASRLKIVDALRRT